jgi:hypothetical protein
MASITLTKQQLALNRIIKTQLLTFRVRLTPLKDAILDKTYN